MMKTVNLMAGGLSLALSGCISTYHAWDGTKGYQEEQLEERQYRISYVAEQATRWDNTRCPVLPPIGEALPVRRITGLDPRLAEPQLSVCE